jgi:importin-5
VLPNAINNTEKQKQKFALFILDDMVEFLGPAYLGENYPQVAKQIIHFCNSPVPAIRQAASYGIGIMAQHGGEAYKLISNDCLAGLKVAIEFHAPSGDKKSKLK